MVGYIIRLLRTNSTMGMDTPRGLEPLSEAPKTPSSRRRMHEARIFSAEEMRQHFPDVFKRTHGTNVETPNAMRAQQDREREARERREPRPATADDVLRRYRTLVLRRQNAAEGAAVVYAYHNPMHDALIVPREERNPQAMDARQQVAHRRRREGELNARRSVEHWSRRLDFLNELMQQYPNTKTLSEVGKQELHAWQEETAQQLQQETKVLEQASQRGVLTLSFERKIGELRDDLRVIQEMMDHFGI
jgi:hypothetical protein